MADVYKFRRTKFGTRTGDPSPRSMAAPQRDWLSWIGITAFVFVLSALGFAWLLGGLDAHRIGAASANTRAATESASFSICRNGSQTDCVVDGDTFRYRGLIYRVADIDTPETRDAMCATERALGEQAKQRLRTLLNAGPFAIEGYVRDEDMYGRKLRIITRDGQSLGMMLVGEGLAREWDGSRHPWC